MFFALGSAASLGWTARRDIIALEALMAAYAELGRFQEAASAGREALALAKSRENDLFEGGLQREIALCEAGQKLRAGCWRLMGRAIDSDRRSVVM